MNDYALINSLLKDGSEQSLLKLKMIVDFDEFKWKLVADGVNVYFTNGSRFIHEENKSSFLKLLTDIGFIDLRNVFNIDFI